MNLTTLTDPRAVCVQAQFTRRDEAIRQLTARLVALGPTLEYLHTLGEGWSAPSDPRDLAEPLPW